MYFETEIVKFSQ